jgi:predicted PurR-regulated permease PerM
MTICPDEEPQPPTTALERRALLGLLLYGAILWGVILALLFTPLYRRLLPPVRQRRTAAALLTLVLMLLLAVLPAVLISLLMAREANAIYEQLQSGALNPTRYFRDLFEALPEGVRSWLDRFGLVDFSTLQLRLTAALVQTSQFIAGQALGFGQDTFAFILHLFITLYLAFFLIRDGEGLTRALRQAIPLAPAHQKALLGTFSVVVRATVKGNLLVAALLWGVVMGFLSLVPAVWAALLWAPVAVNLLVTGYLWQGLALGAWGVMVIGLVDNLLRPLLVGRDTRLPDYVVLSTTLGGMAVFGINGFVLGPAIAALFVAVWHIHTAMRIPCVRCRTDADRSGD